MNTQPPGTSRWPNRAAREEIAAWICRICAVGTLIYGMATVGLEGIPTFGYILITGLFFGPEALKGQLGINRRVNGNGGG